MFASDLSGATLHTLLAFVTLIIGNTYYLLKSVPYLTLTLKCYYNNKYLVLIKNYTSPSVWYDLFRYTITYVSEIVTSIFICSFTHPAKSLLHTHSDLHSSSLNCSEFNMVNGPLGKNDYVYLHPEWVYQMCMFLIYTTCL